ncbi:MAG: DUF2520 domain-containing protein, partial [Inhella sp.]
RAAADELVALASALGARAMMLAPGQRPCYHAAANLAASGLLAPLHAACQLWCQAMGSDEQQAWSALLPLAQGALRAAAAQGLTGALSGPVARGDANVVRSHLHALRGDAAEPLYRAVLAHWIELAAASGRLSSAALAELRALT